MEQLLVVLIYGVMQGSIYTAVALGLVLVFGVTDIVNFAYGELVTIGAFGIIFLTPAVGFPLAVLLTLLIVGIASVVLYYGGFRFTIGNHIQALVLSVAVLLIIQSFMARQFSSIPRRGPSLDGFWYLSEATRIPYTRLVVMVALILLVVLFYIVLKKSWFGLAMRATGDDLLAASSIGLSVRKVGLYAFTVSGLLAALAGIAIASTYAVTPHTGAGFLLKGFVVVIIGGLGSVSGALIVGMGFGILESLGATYIDPSLTNVYGYVLMIAVLLIAPQGLFAKKAVRVG